MDIQLDDKKIASKLTAAGIPENMLGQATEQVRGILQNTMALRLEEELSDEQLKEFQKYAEDSDPSKGVAWILKQFPDYERIVEEELTSIVDNLKKTVEAIRKNAS